MVYNDGTEDIWYTEHVGSKDDNQGHQETDMKLLKFKSDINQIKVNIIVIV